jgi:ribosome maturation protein Sdo1
MTKKEQKPIETVDVTITVKIPKKYYEFLQDLAKMCRITVEYLLADELYCTLANFKKGGFIEAWTENAESLDEFEKQIEQIRP